VTDFGGVYAVTRHAGESHLATIALFGATGKTGRRVLTRALEAGYDVRVLVRTPARLGTVDPRVTVIAGDVLDAAAVSVTVEASNVVLALFGQVKGSPRSLQTDGTRNIVAAMKRHGILRLITLSGGGLRADEDQPKLADHIIRLLLKALAGHVLADAEEHLKLLRSSGLDWTVVRGPMLTEASGRGTYRVGWVGINAGVRLSREDLADFILTQIEDRQFIRRLPFVSE
jgi:putative NADH-flavin reductase